MDLGRQTIGGVLHALSACRILGPIGNIAVGIVSHPFASR